MSRKKDEYPVKQTLNLYYKPDRTTKPATIALYVLFVLTCCMTCGRKPERRRERSLPQKRSWRA